MKFGRLLCVLWVCGSLTLGASAAESPAHNGASVAAADTGQAGGSKGRHAAVAASPRHGPATAQSGVAQVGRSNADHLHSLQQNAQARGQFARQPGGGVGSTRAVTHGAHDIRGPQGATQAGQPKLAASNGAVPPAAVRAGQSKLAASNSAASPAARLTSNPRNSAIGGPHAQAQGVVGGPAIGRTARRHH
jgi:hypothetical protein